MRFAGLLWFSCAVCAQNAAPAFDVATIKLADPREDLDLRAEPGGRLVVTNLPLQMLISQAYDVKPYQISGGPSWLRVDRFDIEAKAEGNPDRVSMMRMLAALLEERFQLKVHRETKEGAACALTVAKSGAKLSPAATLKEGERARVSSGRTGSPTAAAITYWHQGHHASTAMLAATLTTLFSRPVLDQTGLKGDYDFKVEYGADDTQPGDFPSLFTALQEQLGLKLEPAKAPVETLVVDRAEKPSGN